MQNLREFIGDAERRHIALGHFNVSNLEQLKAIENVVRRLDLPVIVGVSEGEREFIGIHEITALIEAMRGEGLPIFLNADHTRSLEKVEEAVHAGFDAILFDGAKLSLQKNIRQTKEAVEIVRAISDEILIEGELGNIGTSSGIFKELPEGAAIKPEDLTKPEEAVRFVKETGVDLFAPAVGNVHGMFANASNPKLDIERIREIKKAVKIPLVLHGGSGISDDDFLKAIDAGISVIHISTELRVAWRKTLEEAFEQKPGEVAPYKLEQDVVQEMEKLVEERLRLFNRL